MDARARREGDTVREEGETDREGGSIDKEPGMVGVARELLVGGVARELGGCPDFAVN